MANFTAEDRALKRIAAANLGILELNNQLYHAARKGWSKVAEKLLVMGSDHDFEFSDRSILSWTCGFGTDDVATAKVLLAANANPNGPGVMEYCGVATLPLLIAAGGKLNGEVSGINPLMSAIVARTKEDKALALIAAGVNVNVHDKNGLTPLMLAAERGRLKVFDALMNAGADLYAVDATGRSVLRRAVETAIGGRLGAIDTHQRKALQILRKLRDYLPAQPEDTILIDIALGDLKELKRKLASKLDPNLQIAGTIGDLGLPRSEYIDRLISHGSVDKMLEGGVLPARQELDCNAGGSSLLMWAVTTRRIPVIKLLLDAGADPTLANDAGVSPRSLAIDWNFKEVHELLDRR
ncbi:MAG: ankyrin repeat domain-containing protein [Bythopirellula sp.]|nr:ankyrin repeat domain-containing protein [Bythopirellula sp.]